MTTTTTHAAPSAHADATAAATARRTAAATAAATARRTAAARRRGRIRDGMAKARDRGEYPGPRTRWPVAVLLRVMIDHHELGAGPATIARQLAEIGVQTPTGRPPTRRDISRLLATTAPNAARRRCDADIRDAAAVIAHEDPAAAQAWHDLAAELPTPYEMATGTVRRRPADGARMGRRLKRLPWRMARVGRRLKPTLRWLTLGGERRARGAEASSLRAVAGSRPDGRGPLRRIEEGRDSAGQGAG